MRHRVAGRHLGRDTAHRVSLYRNLVTDLLRYERITTTEAKAKEIRPMAEKIITLARRGDVHARRQAQRFVFDPAVVKKTFDEIGPRMKDRPGGYLRITGLEPRKGDGARMAVIEFVDYVEAEPTPRPQRVTAAPVAAATPAATADAEAPAEAVEEEAEDNRDMMDRMIDQREEAEVETEVTDEAEAGAAEVVAEPAAEAPAAEEEPEALPTDELAPDTSDAQLQAEQTAMEAKHEEAEERDPGPGHQNPGAPKGR